MKIIQQKSLAHYLFICIISLLFFTSACNRQKGISPDAKSIEAALLDLDYNPEDLLNVQPIGGASDRKEAKNEYIETPDKGMLLACNVKTYDLRNNFGDVAILRPTNGVIWPGALVVGNASMLDGNPDPITLDRAPVSLRLDLPGIGKKGNIEVQDPQNTSVQAAIDEALEWWNANAYQDGYVNAANSSYQAATSYSSRQLSMDIGLNYEWASGDVAAQFNYASSSEERVAMMVYKQVFYTITMDPPKSPGSVFGKDVTVSDFQTAVNSDNPPAYVHSVSYGRIIMFRMRTTVEATDIQLSAALDYARGFDKGSASVEAKSKEILANSSITSITIGGNAEVASRAVTARSFGDLDSIITGENAVYSRSNPGVPIAYTVRYLKDNSFAKMGYVTEYKIEDCSTSEYEHDKITYTHKHSGEARFRIKYKKNGFAYNSAWIEDIGNNESQQKYPPDGSYDIELEVEYKKWGLFQSYESVYKKTLGYVKSKVCYQGTYNSSKDNLVVYPVTCP